MMRFSFLFFAVFGILTAKAQVVQLQFRDAKSDETIQNVVVNMLVQRIGKSDTSLFANSNLEGNLTFQLNQITTLKINYSHPLFESGEKFVRNSKNADTLKLNVLMNRLKVQNIQEITVKAPGRPDTIYHSDRLSVADYEVLQNGDIILLTYPKQLSKSNELLLFDGKNIRSSFQVNDQAEYLTRDYRGNVHVVSKENVFGIQIKKNEIQIAQIPRDYFFKYIEPIIDTNRSKLYYSNYSSNIPEFSYFAYDVEDSTYRKLQHIQDDLMMELYRSEYKWMDIRTKLWARQKELESGIDKEIWIGATYFTSSIYYQEVYAPMFTRNDSIFIFNYPKDKLECYDRFGTPLYTIPIYHHYDKKVTGWKRQVIQDKITGEIYAVYEHKGNPYLGRVNLKTGTIDERVKLNYRYVDKIRVHDNFVYYVYRPYESNQRKFLYRERLPYNFKGQKTMIDSEFSE